MSRRLRPALILLALVLTPSAPASAAGPAEDAELPEVELLNAGQEPRVPLRYEFRPGLKETLEIRMDSSIRLKLDRQSYPETSLPTTFLVFSLDYEEVTDEGDLRCSFVLKEARIEERLDLDPAAMEQVRKETEKLVGAKGWTLVSRRGVTKDGNTTLLESSGPSVRRTVESLNSRLRQLSAPLPEEPVGEGARWSVTSRLTVNGVEVDQTMIFRLLSFRDGKAVLNVKGLQGAQPQAMNLPELPQGAKARLESLSGKANGTLMLDLESAIPRLDCDMELTLQCIVRADGRTAKLELELGTRIGIHRSVSVAPK